MKSFEYERTKIITSFNDLSQEIAFFNNKLESIKDNIYAKEGKYIYQKKINQLTYTNEKYKNQWWLSRAVKHCFSDVIWIILQNIWEGEKRDSWTFNHLMGDQQFYDKFIEIINSENLHGFLWPIEKDTLIKEVNYRKNLCQVWWVWSNKAEAGSENILHAMK